MNPRTLGGVALCSLRGVFVLRPCVGGVRTRRLSASVKRV